MTPRRIDAIERKWKLSKIDYTDIAWLIERVKEGEKDYEGMRDMQKKFIESDHHCRELEKKISRVLNYCKGNTNQMWAATIVTAILGGDFRDAEQILKKYLEDDQP